MMNGSWYGFLITAVATPHAMAADALDASRINMKPGGVQPRIHITVWAGMVQEEFPSRNTEGYEAGVRRERHTN